ncbi:methyltransferase [Nonomuraea sp. NPDC049695]|uniref:methyltransferase n=1 Tax=Nonomuraea sp. NPDC049695 TaxID=3154734 RepID=UPI00341AAA85
MTTSEHSSSGAQATSPPMSGEDEPLTTRHPHGDDAPSLLRQRAPESPRPPSVTPAYTTPRDIIQDMINAPLRFAALHAFVSVGGPERLAAAGELSGEELAARCDADPAMMGQLLSALHCYGIVVAHRGRYQLSPTGMALRPDADDSMYAAVKVTGSSLWWQAAGTLDQTVRTGHPAVLDGARDPYELLAEEPDLAALFDQFMVSRSAAVGHELASLADGFVGAQTVADLGGGQGGVLAAILHAHPTLRGVLVERADVAARASAYLTGQGLAERSKVVVSDIFSVVFPGAQRYLLSSILHNWSDLECVTLLALIGTAMRDSGPDAELWCIEAIKPAQPGEYSPTIDLGLRMMAMFPGGKERTLEELLALMEQAGLRCRTTLSLAHGQTLLIAVPAEAGN